MSENSQWNTKFTSLKIISINANITSNEEIHKYKDNCSINTNLLKALQIQRLLQEMALQLQRLPRVNSYKIFTHYSLTCKKFCLNQFINLEEKCTILFAKLFLSNLFKHCNLSMFLETLAIASFVLLNYLMNFFLLFFCFFSLLLLRKRL